MSPIVRPSTLLEAGGKSAYLCEGVSMPYVSDQSSYLSTAYKCMQQVCYGAGCFTIHMCWQLRRCRDEYGLAVWFSSTRTG